MYLRTVISAEVTEEPLSVNAPIKLVDLLRIAKIPEDEVKFLLLMALSFIFLILKEIE